MSVHKKNDPASGKPKLFFIKGNLLLKKTVNNIRFFTKEN
tara:strand:+ start:10349 stop:10468 length:120 start_codon:yes stop_codon:yes gene_type:complete